jgi:ketosteroid isomerase-like protein
MARNVETLKQIYGAFGRGDIGSGLVHFDLGVVWAEPEGPVTRFGVAAVAREVAGAVPKHFETFALQLDKFIDGIDTVLVTGYLGGRGRPNVKVAFVHLWELRDGKVTRFKNYEDMPEAMRSLGRNQR